MQRFPISFFHILLIGLLAIVIYFMGCRSSSRVKKAYQHKALILQNLYKDKGIAQGASIFVRVFKQEQKLEIWALKDKKFVLLKAYPICAASGVLGRKKKEGDRQVPEGIYKILIFNEKSDYHLSLGINYPNEADHIWADKDHAGGDIYIHGNCVSVGCLAMTDDLIEEIYIIAYEARKAGQREIPIHIFPFNMRIFTADAIQPEVTQHYEFWQELKPIFDFFEQNRQLPKIWVNKQGKYLIAE